jgi:hypothetical protein
MNPLSIITGLFSMGTAWVQSSQKRKAVKLESDLRVNEAITTAKIKKISTGQHADIAWENTSIQNAGWKDEWFTIVLSIPAIMCFVPGYAQYISAGFDSLKGTPEWYQMAFLVAIASSFGFKKLADFMSIKKGG